MYSIPAALRKMTGTGGACVVYLDAVCSLTIIELRCGELTNHNSDLRPSSTCVSVSVAMSPALGLSRCFNVFE